MNKNKLLEYYKTAQKTVEALGDFYDKHTDFLSTHNLKLYDANFYNCSEEMQKDFPLCYSNSQKNDVDYFYEFCEQAYEDYRNLYPYHGDNEKYIGRTSSFFFVPHQETTNASDYIDSNTYKNKGNFVGDLFSYIVYDVNASYYISLSEKNNILFDDKEEVLNNEEIFENVCCYLEDIGNYDIELLFADALELYEYIDDFKKNQVEYFKDFLRNEEENLFFDNKTEKQNFDALEKCITHGLKSDNYTDNEKAYITLILENARNEIL